MASDAGVWQCCSEPVNLVSYLCHARLQQPRDVYYIPDFVTEQQETLLADAIAADSRKWVQLRGRRLQCHGGTVLPEGTLSEPLPGHLQRFCTYLCARGLQPTNKSNWNHVLVNEYAPGEGIMPHCDGPLYLPMVV